VAPDDAKQLICDFYKEVWDRGNVDVCERVFAPDCVRHDLRPTQALPGPEGQKRIAAEFRAAFPDLRFEVEIVLAEDDFVAARWTASGTHSGAWAGIEPTGRSMSFSGVNIFRFENGLVAEIWNHRDDLGLMQQLGVPVYAGAAGDDT
jgi:steroid delta-isomerase-like uncharacterized protein